MDWMAVEDQYSTGVYAKRSICISHGSGATLTDSDGKTYIDCTAGIGTSNIGHANPRWVKALAEQAAKVVSCPEMFPNQQRAIYMQELVTSAPENLTEVFFCNSGTEAIEGAIKFARISSGRSEIIAAKRGFHGRTMGALSATWNKKYREPFEPLVPGYSHITYNDINGLDAITESTAAIILELVQGESGVYPIDPEFLQAVRDKCDQTGTSLIIDEVQTGFGRTGKLFAIQHYPVKADFLCLAKSIAGGFPMGAILIDEKFGKFSPSIHGTTFGGNPLACAAASEALKIIQEEKLAENAATLGQEFMQALAAIDSPLIRDVRGQGLMVGVELKQKVAPYIKQLGDLGVLALPAGMTVLRFLPPLVITREQLQQVVEAVRTVLTAE